MTASWFPPGPVKATVRPAHGASHLCTVAVAAPIRGRGRRRVSASLRLGGVATHRVRARRTPPLVGGRGARILGLTRTEGAPMLEDSRGPATGGVLLVGSVPLRSAEEVFQVMAAELGDRVTQLPDGETGPRSDWIVWQYPVLSSRPEFEVCPPGDQVHRSLPRLRVRDGESLDTLRFDDLGYAEAAISSYQAFARRKRDGHIPADCRFQVSLPTPLAPIAAFVAPEDQAGVEPLYEERMVNELAGIFERIPHDQLADPVGHELRVRHARRGHADLVRRPPCRHRRAPGPARSQRPRRRPARLSLLPRPREPPSRPALPGPAPRRHGQRPVAQPRPVARLGPSAGAVPRRRPALLRDAGHAEAPPRDAAVPGPARSVRRRARGPGPDRRRAALRPRLRGGHRLRLGPPPSRRRGGADRAASGRDLPDPTGDPGAPGLRLAGRLAAPARRRLGPPAGGCLR